MKVVHISTSDANGGAAIAARRLHLYMLNKGIDSNMLVMRKNIDELNIRVAKEGKIEEFILSNLRKFINYLALRNYIVKENIIFSTGNSGIDVSRNKLLLEADEIYLHWVEGGFLSLNSIKKIAKLNKKVKWVLHDSWAFTGGCHIRYNCKKYQEKCGACPMLNSLKEKDISRKVFNKKKKVYSYFKDLTIITPSKWLGECVKKSSLLKEFHLEIRPNVLNNKNFKNLNKNFCREVLNLKKNKKYILFGAMNATTTSYKGWKYLKKSLILFSKSKEFLEEEIELLVFGASYSENIQELPFKVNFLGMIYDEYTLALIYNSADVFVVPSLEDNYPNTILESLNCRTFVVAFNVGGIPEMIKHKKNGYLANYKDTTDLFLGIKEALEVGY